jgi:short-subunit dehydrogenase
VSRQIADKVIIVTGASSGIGRATALALARERARLVLVARREPLLVQLREEIRKFNEVPEVLTLDLAKRANVETMIDEAHRRFGRIDVLINNAGIGFFGTVEHTPPVVVREIFQLNFEAPLIASQLVAPIMRSQGAGHIINISSIAGKRGLPLAGIYCATKFALNGVTEALRLELKASGIDVSLINPASTRTEFHEHVIRGDVLSRFKPLGPVQSVEVVADAVVQCIRRPRPEVYPNRVSRFVVWANALAPALVDKFMIPYFRDRMRAKAGYNENRA